jgi:hypothetical protein
MYMKTTIIGISWPTSGTLQKYPVVKEAETSEIRSVIENMLFDNPARINQCLLKHNDVMYVCEPIDNKQYSRTIVQYHPYMSLLQ